MSEKHSELLSPLCMSAHTNKKHISIVFCQWMCLWESISVTGSFFVSSRSTKISSRHAASLFIQRRATFGGFLLSGQSACFAPNHIYIHDIQHCFEACNKSCVYAGLICWIEDISASCTFLVFIHVVASVFILLLHSLKVNNAIYNANCATMPNVLLFLLIN